MNTYKKYCPNVFVAKCESQHKKNDIITLNTKYGQEHENEVCNYLGQTNDGYYLYSITRVDGFNSQERAKKKAEKLNGYATNAEKRSDEKWEASNEGRDFLILAEPIKIGHHSEKRHRALIERNHNRMRQSIEEGKKAKAYITRAEYWAEMAEKINLSMPESLEYFEFKLEQEKAKHLELKKDPSKRRHSMSLQYANKSVKDTEKNLHLAVKLWGSQEEAQQLAEEKREKAETATSKTKEKQDLVKKYGGFFAFNSAQLIEGFNKIKAEGHLEEGEKVKHLLHGLYLPSKNIDNYLAEL